MQNKHMEKVGIAGERKIACLVKYACKGKGRLQQVLYTEAGLMLILF